MEKNIKIPLRLQTTFHVLVKIPQQTGIRRLHGKTIQDYGMGEHETMMTSHSQAAGVQISSELPR
jgi:hypothetical protein